MSKQQLMEKLRLTDYEAWNSKTSRRVGFSYAVQEPIECTGCKRVIEKNEVVTLHKRGPNDEKLVDRRAAYRKSALPYCKACYPFDGHRKRIIWS
jgi:hypothetical protein